MPTGLPGIYESPFGNLKKTGVFKVIVDMILDTINILGDNNTALSSNGTTSVENISKIIRWISFAIGLPTIGFSIYLMSLQAKNGKAGPVYLISLLASDIFSIFGRPAKYVKDAENTFTMNTDLSSLIFYFGIISNIVFMVCVAQERYLLVTCPQYDAFCMKLKQSSMISLAVWAAPFVILFLAFQKYFLLFSIALLLPLPLLVFFFLDSFRALWCTTRPAPVTNRNRILAMQAVILSNYSIIYLPFVLNILLNVLSLRSYIFYLGLVADLLLYLGPLVDPFLSIFLTNGVSEILKAFPCCARSNMQEDTDAVDMDTVDTVDTETVETVSGTLTRL